MHPLTSRSRPTLSAYNCLVELRPVDKNTCRATYHAVAECYSQQPFVQPRINFGLQAPVVRARPVLCRDARSAPPDTLEDKLKSWVPLALGVIGLATAIYNTSSSFKGLSDQIDKNQAVILEKFNNVDTKFANVDTKFANVDTKFANVDTKFANVEAKFDAVGKQIEKLEMRLSQLKGKLYVVRVPEKSP